MLSPTVAAGPSEVLFASTSSAASASPDATDSVSSSCGCAGCASSPPQAAKQNISDTPSNVTMGLVVVTMAALLDPCLSRPGSGSSQLPSGRGSGKLERAARRNVIDPDRV